MINTLVSIWREIMRLYLSLDTTCSLMLTVFLEFRSPKTVRILDLIMSADKYPCLFPRHIEAIVYIFPGDIPQFQKLMSNTIILRLKFHSV